MSVRKIHGFRAQLNYSEQHRDFWTDIYKKAFPDYQNHMNLVGRSESQRRGMDVVLTLKSGLTLFIDEKLRPVTRGEDILLEYISVDKSNEPGWIEKPLGIHYIAYAFRDTGICYMLDWPLLRSAWLKFGNQWKRDAASGAMGYREVVAKNEGYNTISIAVPIYDLQIAMDRCSVIQGAPSITANVSNN